MHARVRANRELWLDPQRPDHVETVGPFTLGAIIGSGGFGTVYRATDASGREVALKLLAPHMDSRETLQRFHREGTIRIEHPNVVRVIDAGVDRGVSYIAFELLEGRPLNALLEEAPLPVEEVLDLAKQIARGLAAAHARDIVHRDLKPGNVFCCNDGSVKILDFGIARPMSQAGPQLTMAGSVIGTPGYLAPEQAKGDPVILPAADLWSLGVILYQALDGKNPFLRQSAVATILAVVIEEVPVLEAREGLPPGMAEVVRRCLQKEPAERWSSADELLVALEGIDLSASLVTPPVAMSIPVGERRVVALLLASEVHDVEKLEASVREWGGELIAMLGGAIGVFGGRTYEGDEGIRAVQAGLAARETAGFMAVATGHATGAGASVSGDAVRAVELAVEVRVGGVAVDARTARSLEGQFELRPAGPEVFEVPRALSRRETGSFPLVREDLPLLGRADEIAAIEEAARIAFDERRAAVAWVSGPPGIGKSRLRAELERRLRERNIPLLVARGESHRRDAAYHLLGSLLRSAPTLEPFLLNPGVSTNRRRRALTDFLEDTLGDPIWSRQCAEPIARLLGLPTGADEESLRRSDPQLMADQVRLSVGDLLGALSARNPLAILIDDAQWGDDASLTLLDEIVERRAESPLLVFLASRPQLAEARPALFSGGQETRIEPQGLDADDVATVAAAIARREIPAPVAREIATRTGGNPFFVEQIVRELVEQNLLDQELDSLPIPLDVEGAVQSRLDHLPAAEKQLCKRAAVYSGGFTERGLRALDVPEPGRELGALARRGLLGVRGADEAEREYHFRNSLVADVAYQMNTEEARVDLHRRAAEHLEAARTRDREEVARHWELGDEPERGAQTYAEAALRASSRGDTASVLRCAEHALALGLEGARAFDLHLLRADALSFLGRQGDQRASLEEAHRLAATAAQRARVLSEMGWLLAAGGEADEGIRLVVQAVAEARLTGDRELLAGNLARHSWVHLFAGRVAEAAETIHEATAIPGLSQETAALVAAWRGQLFSQLGDLGKRRRAFEEAAATYVAMGDLRRAAAVECNLADTYNRVGAYEEAEAALREAVASSRRVGNRIVEGYALVNLGYALAGQGRIEEALSTYDLTLALAEELGRPRLALAARLYRARAELERDPPLDVAERLRRVAEEAAERGLPTLQASALALASRAALEGDDAEAALEDAERAMELRDEIGTMEEDESIIFLALAEALFALGERERGREMVARGASRLEFLAGRIEDVDWRARFLVEVPVNRRLIELDGQE